MMQPFKIILFLIYANFGVFGQIATLNNSPYQIREKTFERVWDIVNERHFDPSFGGVDWGKIGEKYRPVALAANSDSEFHNILNQMVGELNQSHFNIYTKEAEAESAKCNDGVIGIEIRLIDGKAIINRVEKYSSAEKVNIKTGFEITKIDGRTIPEILWTLENNLASRKITEASKQTYRERTVTRAVCGKSATSVKLEIINDKNQLRNFEVKRVAYKGEIIRVADGIPPFKPLFEAKWLSKQIGYISFNVWIPKQAERVQNAIRSMNDATGIIIDLRNNAGGQGNLVNNVGGLLFKERVSFGKTRRRFTEGEFFINPQRQAYQGKIVILTNCGTGSTSEIFTAGMKETGRAKIIGERTAGAVLPAIVERLPSGANFLHAIADYRSPAGILIEGRGVEPDIEVKLTRQTLLEGRDLQLEKAINEISK